jgi:signal transduction histidine kinase
VFNGKAGQGIRTRVLLLISLVLIVAGTTASSLLVVRNRLQQHVRQTLTDDLLHSVQTFQDLEANRRITLEDESTLLANLPSLKALMTTSDPRTIADDAEEFWKPSGNDLFALSDPDFHVLAARAHNADAGRLKADLEAAIADPARHYLQSGNRLYEYAVRPLYFGSPTQGTVLGYVISGYSIDHRFLLEVGRGAGAEAAFVIGNSIAISTLPPEKHIALISNFASISPGKQGTLEIGAERFLATSQDLSNGSAAPLRLVVMKSFAEADRTEREINRLISIVSLLAIVIGIMLMLLLARMVTGPLEQLANGVRAFGEGDPQYLLPTGGTLEVRYLSRVFAEMRNEIQRKSRALLESERLATIGRMASSVSHDLRHYLAAVYANAEFLASPVLPASERAELFDEIRIAVNGTTDMLDSMLIFGRNGAAVQRVPTSLNALVGRVVALVRAHPDAASVAVLIQTSESELVIPLDSKQMERAIYNLLLNACQSSREGAEPREVRVSINADDHTAAVTIIDSGPGVPEGIRDSLFDPFVSRGKQKGTGLGLTVAWTVAREHGGSVQLVSSRPGETIFRLMISRAITLSDYSTSSRSAQQLS